MRRSKYFVFSTKRNRVDLTLVLVASVLTLIFADLLRRVEPDSVLRTVKYIPIMIVTAFCGIIPGMLSLVLIFFFGSFLQGSIMYHAFAYLLIACAVNVLTRIGFFQKFF
ncbi:hypothetical protein [Butyrivibrio sp. AE3003]|uniref:hypothetical protein n=1 Tax=Butyrivibrio sp. AE3003 TaxID=1496721 RepID=UPI00047D200B|nr:hypothetical protein [Butyrivibrio sp. AE3003]